MWPRASSRGAASATSISTTCACAATSSRAWVAEACAHYGRDAGRVVALGYSNGANIAVELLFRHGGLAARRRAAAPDAARTGRDEPLSLAGTDVLIAPGDADPYSSPQQIEELAELLAAGGAEVQVVAPAGRPRADAGRPGRARAPGSDRTRSAA